MASGLRRESPRLLAIEVVGRKKTSLDVKEDGTMVMLAEWTINNATTQMKRRMGTPLAFQVLRSPWVTVTTVSKEIMSSALLRLS